MKRRKRDILRHDRLRLLLNESRQHFRLEHPHRSIGEKLFVDYAGRTVPIYGSGGVEAFRAHLFVSATGASGRHVDLELAAERKERV